MQGVEHMDINKITNLLSTKIPNEKILLNEPMKKHTTFKIGGPADIFLKPTSIEELASAVKICNRHEVPYYIIGNGSNLLIEDAGYRGVIIQIGENFSAIKVEGNRLVVESGALLLDIANTALAHSLTGFEFAHGIPGTLGGAVTMNAGAYGGEIKDVIVSSTVLDQEGNVQVLSKEELELGYRTSRVQKNNMIVLSATLELALGDKTAIEETMKDLLQRRTDKQPLERPSAGSTFKRPEGHFTGKLIMDAGLRGYQIGGAMVSEKHCGFVVSDGTATFEDVIALIEHIRFTIKEKFNVVLEPEVRIIKNKDKK